MLKIIDIDKEHKQLRLSFKALVSGKKKAISEATACPSFLVFEGMPKNIKGFGPLNDAMPKWIKEKEEC